MKSILFSFAKEFEADIKNIPARLERTESRKAAAFLVVFSIIFALLPLAAVLWTLREGQFDPRMLGVAIPFFLIGLAVFIHGVNLGIKKTVVDIGYDEVRYRFRSLFKKTEWAEKLGSFRGVLVKKKMRGKHDCNIIELHHDREDRRVELAVYLTNLVPESHVREKWEEYSRRLDLPAMRETADGVTARDPGDAGTAIRDLHRDDGDAVVEVPPPPGGLALGQSGGFQEVDITSKRTLRPGTLFLLLLSALLVWIGFFARNDRPLNFIAVGAFGSVMGGWVMLYTFFDLLTTQSLRFMADKVILFRKTPFGRTRGKSVYAGQVRDVRVDLGTVHRVNALVIDAGKNSLQMGHGLPMESLRWLRDFTIEKIRAS